MIAASVLISLVGTLLSAGSASGQATAVAPAPIGSRGPVIATSAKPKPAVVERRVLGHTRSGRPIKAWRLGEPGAPKYVVISTMHGNERHTKRIVAALRDGRRIRGIDLWVVPVYNPDGFARNTRKNVDGSYESGPGPASEPETRAMMAFLSEIQPRRIVSFHQPLNGVDVNTKKPKFARRLGRALRLPRTSLNCGGVCHGTMTSWYNANFKGAALTVEYGAHPSRHRTGVQAPRALLRVLGGRRGKR
jgi:murein peptide amidase A